MRNAAWILITITVLAGASVGIYFALKDDSGGSDPAVTSTGSTSKPPITSESVGSTSPQFSVFEGHIQITENTISDSNLYNGYTNVSGRIEIHNFDNNFALPSEITFENLLDISNELVISASVNFDNLFQAVEKIGGDLFIQHPGIDTLNGAFPDLIEIGGINNNNIAINDASNLAIIGGNTLTTLGNAFPKLRKLGPTPHHTSNAPSTILYVGGASLTTLGTAFASLRRISGPIAFGSAVQNFSALDNLECHGGIFQDGTANDFCLQCPKSLKEKSFCCGKENEMDCTDCPSKTCIGNNVPSKQIDSLCLCCPEDLGYVVDGNSWKCASCTELGLNIDPFGYCTTK